MKPMNPSNEPSLIVTEDELEIDAATLKRSASGILLVPEGWPTSTEKPIYAGSTQSLLKLAKAHGLPIQVWGDFSADSLTRDNRSADWVAPTMFVTPLLLSQDPNGVALALNVISNYVTDLFKGLQKDPAVELTLLHADGKTKRATRVKYKGPVSGLSQVNNTILKLNSPPRK